MSLTYQQAARQLGGLVGLPDQVAPGVAPAIGGPATKALVIANMVSAGLPATGFPTGDPSERWCEITANTIAQWGGVATMAVRAPFFALSTDPGDVDDFGSIDPATDQTPRPGWLSAFGIGWWGVQRGGLTYATTTVTIKNNGTTTTQAFAAGQLVLEASGITLPNGGGNPTYITTPDPSIYTGGGNTLTLAPGASVSGVPVIAQQPGSLGSAAANQIDTCVTQTFGALVVTASATAIGSDRQSRTNYIAACQASADANSIGGPVDAYVTACTLQRDVTNPGNFVPLQRYDGSGPTNIAQVYVSPSSATGAVTIYVAGPTGPVDSIDVSSATANILGIPMYDSNGKQWNPQPMGVVAGCTTIGPTTNDPNITPAGTPGCASCTNVGIGCAVAAEIKSSKVAGGATPGLYYTPWAASTYYVVGCICQNGGNVYAQRASVGKSASSGGPTGTGSGISDGTATWDYVSPGTAADGPTLDVVQAIQAAVAKTMLATGIGGEDQVAGAGVFYTAEITPAVKGSYQGLYAATCFDPAALSTPIGVGQIANTTHADGSPMFVAVTLNVVAG